MTKASDNAFPSLLILEATEPSAPAAGHQRLYIDSTTHLLKATNSSGTDRTIESTAGTNPTAGKVVRTANASAGSDYTTTSATLVDVDATNVTITITTLARRVLIGLVGTGSSSSATGRADYAFKVDGSVPAGAHVEISQHSETSNFMNISFTFLTDVLSAGSHTFVLQHARGSAGTLTTNANATNTLTFWVQETMSTT